MNSRRPNSEKLLPRARLMRRDSTEGEQRLWSRLRDRRLQGHKFRRQTPVGPYIADFACVDAKLIVEVDGGQHNDEPNRAYDHHRTQTLESLGWRVIRFWADAVLRDTDLVLEGILIAVGSTDARPSPQPSPGVPGEGARTEARL